MTRNSHWTVYIGFKGDLTTFAREALPVYAPYFDYVTVLGTRLCFPLSALPRQKIDDNDEGKLNKPLE